MAGIGAATSLDGRPYLFVKGSDGNLWVRWHTGVTWKWTNQGAAPSTIASGIGGATSSHGPAVFMLDQAGGVLAQWWQGEQQQWRWTDLGSLPGTGSSGDGDGAQARIADAAVAAMPTGDAAVFVLSGDGRLYKNQVPDNQWEPILPPRTGIAVSKLLGAAVTSGAPGVAAARCVLATTEDGQVWVWREQQYSVGVWAPIGAPNGRTVTRSLGVAPYVAVVQCDDGTIHWCEWDPDGGGNWVALGLLPDDQTASAGLTLNTAAYPYIYPHYMLSTAEGPVVLGSFFDRSAIWDDRGAPGTTTPVSTVGFLPYQNDFLTAVVGADGRLWA